MPEIKTGMKLFYKKPNGMVKECQVINIYEENGRKKLKIMIPREPGEKEEKQDVLSFLLRQIGETLFFNEEDTKLTLEELAYETDYVKYGNTEIKKILKPLEELQKHIDEIERIEEKRRERITKNVIEILESRGIKHLVYFARIENLKSILQNGIVPELYHSKKGICAIKNRCEKKHDFQRKGNGYSIEFPNYKLLYRLRKEGNAGDSYVIVCLDAKSVLLDTVGKHIYCKDNALTCGKKFDGANFEKLFLNTYSKELFFCNMNGRKNISVKRKELLIPENYTTNPQAEIVICDIVEPKYIKQVIFESNAERQSWLTNNGELQNSDVEFIVDKHFFAPRSDYEFWK